MICCLLRIPELHVMYTVLSNGAVQVMQTELASSRACLHCMHDLLIDLCRPCGGAFLWGTQQHVGEARGSGGHEPSG